MKKLFLAAALVAGSTSVALAQGVYVSPNYDNGAGYYNYSPGYGYGYYNAAPGYGYRNDYYNGNNTVRGGPGPRVGAGSGTGIGSQR